MKIILYAFVLISLFLSSCNSLYLAGYTGSEYHHLETPFAKKDSTVTAHYIKGGIQEGVKFYKKEKNDIQYVGYHYAISKSYFSFAAGVNAFHGNYTVNSFINESVSLNKGYDYWGGEILAKVNVNIPISEHLHWRIIGAQMSWNMERGPFYDFRDNIVKMDEAMEDAATFMDTATNLSFYGNTEFYFHPAKDLYIGINYAFGLIFKYLSFSSIVGANIEYKGIGLKCNYREGTPSLLHASIPTFNNKINNNIDSWQYAVYFKF
ncbi:MAG: hypothetical protein WBG43_10090 [Marinifilaceae bacterium]